MKLLTLFVPQGEVLLLVGSDDVPVCPHPGCEHDPVELVLLENRLALAVCRCHVDCPAAVVGVAASAQNAQPLRNRAARRRLARRVAFGRN